jgi:long-chain acyl-CoA synthetase
MQELTLLNLLEQRVGEQPDEVWLRDLHSDSSSAWTWKEAYSQIQAVACWIQQELGEKGNSLSILSRNRAHWVLSDMAIVASDNVSVPMFTTQSSEIAKYIFDFTDVRLLFVGEADNWPKIRDVLPEGITIVTFPGVEVDVPALKWDEIVDEFSGQHAESATKPDDLTSIVFTSGTTGMPKGVMQTNSSLILPIARLVEMLELIPNPRLISYLPLSHIAERIGIVVQSMYLGGEVSFIESAETLVRDLQRTTPTFFFGAPRIWEALQQGIYSIFNGRASFEESMAADQQATASKARAFLGFQNIDRMMSGAAPISTSLLKFYDDLGPAGAFERKPTVLSPATTS